LALAALVIACVLVVGVLAALRLDESFAISLAAARNQTDERRAFGLGGRSPVASSYPGSGLPLLAGRHASSPVRVETGSGVPLPGSPLEIWRSRFDLAFTLRRLQSDSARVDQTSDGEFLFD
jgi:hypothetical protein